MNKTYKLVQAPYGSPLFDHCRDIRMAVFVDEQGYPAKDEMDEYDIWTVHLLLLEQDSDKPVGTLRYFPPSESAKSQKLGRLAVIKKARGKGCASLLVKGLEEMLLAGQIDGVQMDALTEINCNAQVPVVPFYKGLGYVCEGDEFQEDGTPHIFMRKTLHKRS